MISNKMSALRRRRNQLEKEYQIEKLKCTNTPPIPPPLPPSYTNTGGCIVIDIPDMDSCQFKSSVHIKTENDHTKCNTSDTSDTSDTIDTSNNGNIKKDPLNKEGLGMICKDHTKKGVNPSKLPALGTDYRIFHNQDVINDLTLSPDTCCKNKHIIETVVKTNLPTTDAAPHIKNVEKKDDHVDLDLCDPGFYMRFQKLKRDTCNENEDCGKNTTDIKPIVPPGNNDSKYNCCDLNLFKPMDRSTMLPKSKNRIKNNNDIILTNGLMKKNNGMILTNNGLMKNNKKNVTVVGSSGADQKKSELLILLKDACIDNDTETILCIVNDKTFDVTYDEERALHIACSTGNLVCLKALLENKKTLSSSKYPSWDPIGTLMVYQHEDLLEYMVMDPRVRLDAHNTYSLKNDISSSKGRMTKLLNIARQLRASLEKTQFDGTLDYLQTCYKINPVLCQQIIESIVTLNRIDSERLRDILKHDTLIKYK